MQLLVIIILAHLSLLNSAWAQTENCAPFTWVDINDEALTIEEKIALLDNALVESINNSIYCLEEKQNSASGGGGGGGGSSGGGGGNAGGGESGAEAIESIAAEGISGTQAPADNTPPTDSANSADAEQTDTNNTAPDTTADPNTPDSGKVPDDIPPADNDSILQQRIREAAMNETDPEKREKLWDEYRKLQ